MASCPNCPVVTRASRQITSYLNRLASDLEAAAYPALDALTGRVTAHNLERVRRIKGRLVRLSTRVQTVRARVRVCVCLCVCVCVYVCVHVRAFRRSRPHPVRLQVGARPGGCYGGSLRSADAAAPSSRRHSPGHGHAC
jgi:hypothetical protein